MQLTIKFFSRQGIAMLIAALFACNEVGEKVDSPAEPKLDANKGSVDTATQTAENIPEISFSSHEHPKSGIVVAVIKKLVPSVVSIHSEKLIDVQPHQYFNPFEDFFRFFEDPFSENPRRQQKPKTRKYKQQGLGSGVILNGKGHVITNHHVAGESDDIIVTLSNDREYQAEIIGTDKLSDVALLRIKDPPSDLPSVAIGNSDHLEVGETVLAIGNPFGYSNTVTKGIVSAKGRAVGLSTFENYLQTDAAINPGNSGGALVNLKGELVGINTAIASRTGASNGIGFAIPINMAKKIMNDLLEKGRVERGYLGVYLQEMNQNLAQALGLEKSLGVLVTSVIEDSPAEKSGFKDRDVIVELNGKKVKNVNELRNAVALLQPKTKSSFTILREKKSIRLDVKIGKREDNIMAMESKTLPDNLGITVENINRQLIQRYRLRETEGAVVTEVKPGSASDRAGLSEGDVILKVGDKNIFTAADFKKAIKKTGKGTALILADRQGDKVFIGLKIK